MNVRTEGQVGLSKPTKKNVRYLNARRAQYTIICFFATIQHPFMISVLWLMITKLLSRIERETVDNEMSTIFE